MTEVLDSYRGIFRKSSRTSSKTNEHFYTLQLRYALKHNEYTDSAEIENDGSPLDVKSILDLISLISERAEREEDSDLALKKLEQFSDLTMRELALSSESLNLANKEINVTQKSAKMAFWVALLSAVLSAIVPILVKS